MSMIRVGRMGVISGPASSVTCPACLDDDGARGVRTVHLQLSIIITW